MKLALSHGRAGFGLSVFLLATCAPQTGAQSPTPSSPSESDVDTMRRTQALRREARFAPGEVIVKTKRPTLGPGPADKLDLVEVAETSGGETVYRLRAAERPTLSKGEVLQETLKAIDELRKDPNVEYAEPNYIAWPSGAPSDREFAGQWSLLPNGTEGATAPGGIGVTKAWEVTKGSTSIVVAVIDTGLVGGHPDLTGGTNVLPGYDMIADPKTAKDGDGRDKDPSDPGDGTAADDCLAGDPATPDTWHGSHVAGIIGAGATDNVEGIAGINWAVKVLPIRVLGWCGGKTTDIADAVRWAAGLPVPKAPRNRNPARVINLSLDIAVPCSKTPSLRRAIADAVAKGALVVAAAGNYARDASEDSPASCESEGLLTVAASERRGHLALGYSNFGMTVEILAPGGDLARDDDRNGVRDGILSLVQGGYRLSEGTSMAAPHVSGVAALLLARNPNATSVQLRERITRTALPRSAEQCPRPCGAGLLDAGAALRQ